MTTLNLGWLEVILIDLAALVTIISFIYFFLKSKHDKLEARFQRHEDRINDLAAACIRRDEIKTIVDQLNHQLTEIRQRIDNVLKP